MKFYNKTVEINGETFEVVAEYGDCIYWIPGEEHTFQVQNRNGRDQRIAGTSYEAFGSDMYRAKECEKKWIEEARRWHEK